MAYSPLIDQITAAGRRDGCCHSAAGGGAVMLESFIQWVDRQLVDPENERKLAEAIARCKHGKKSWVWLGGVMTNTVRCQACGKEFTPTTMSQDKSQ